MALFTTIVMTSSKVHTSGFILSTRITKASTNINITLKIGTYHVRTTRITKIWTYIIQITSYDDTTVSRTVIFAIFLVIVL